MVICVIFFPVNRKIVCLTNDTNTKEREQMEAQTPTTPNKASSKESSLNDSEVPKIGMHTVKFLYQFSAKNLSTTQ